MKQGRVVIIGGTPRSGKTTLAVRLAHAGFSKMSFDHLSDALRKGFSEISLDDWTDQEACATRLYAFFESIVESALNDAVLYGINTVVDMYDFTPDYISRLPFLKDLEIYFLAYPCLSVDEIRYNIKFYAEPTDWIAQVDEDYLDVVARRCFSVNNKLVEQCRRNDFELINTTSGNDRIRALDELFDRIFRNNAEDP